MIFMNLLLVLCAHPGRFALPGVARSERSRQPAEAVELKPQPPVRFRYRHRCGQHEGQQRDEENDATGNGGKPSGFFQLHSKFSLSRNSALLARLVIFGIESKFLFRAAAQFRNVFRE